MKVRIVWWRKRLGRDVARHLMTLPSGMKRLYHTLCGREVPDPAVVAEFHQTTERQPVSHICRRCKRAWNAYCRRHGAKAAS